MGNEGKEEWNQEEDTNTCWLVLEDGSQTVNAVLHGGTILELLEVEEEAWSANTIAVESIFNRSCESLDVRTDLNIGALQIV